MLASGYAPVAVGQEPGNQYIVIAPEGAELPFQTEAPKTTMSVEEHSQMLHERTFAAQLRTRVQGIAERGRPGQQIRNVPVDPTPGTQVGIGRNTGEIRVQRRVDIATGQGVGPDGHVDALSSELGNSSPSPFTSCMRQPHNRHLTPPQYIRIHHDYQNTHRTAQGT